jgi:hypothetical protein
MSQEFRTGGCERGNHKGEFINELVKRWKYRNPATLTAVSEDTVPGANNPLTVPQWVDVTGDGRGGMTKQAGDHSRLGIPLHRPQRAPGADMQNICKHINARISSEARTAPEVMAFLTTSQTRQRDHAFDLAPAQAAPFTRTF